MMPLLASNENENENIFVVICHEGTDNSIFLSNHNESVSVIK